MIPTKLTIGALEYLAAALHEDYRLGRYSIDNKDDSPMYHQLNEKSRYSWLNRASVIYQMVINKHLADKLQENAAKKKTIKRKKKTIYKKRKKNSKRR